mmetsp:Transcript_13113/g.32138  ORF Transcript_13113/g.32138 Transcript_13113/m.32138 type:complete len:441 (+) Transcript_13113:89-1411(+)
MSPRRARSVLIAVAVYVIALHPRTTQRPLAASGSVSEEAQPAKLEDLAKEMRKIAKRRKRIFDEQRAKGGSLYFYKHSRLDPEYGPWHEDQIRRWQKMGIVTKSTLIRRENETDFRRVGSVGIHASSSSAKRTRLPSPPKDDSDGTVKHSLEKKAEELRVKMLEAADKTNYIEAQEIKIELVAVEKQIRQQRANTHYEDEYGAVNHKMQIKDLRGSPMDVWIPCMIEQKNEDKTLDVSFYNGDILRGVPVAEVYRMTPGDEIRRIKLYPPVVADPKAIYAIGPHSKYPTVIEGNSESSTEDAAEIDVGNVFRSDETDEQELRVGAQVEVLTSDNPFSFGEPEWCDAIVREVRENGCMVTKNLDPELFPNNPPVFYSREKIRLPQRTEILSMHVNCPKGHTCRFYQGKFPREYESYPECDSCGNQQTVNRSIAIAFWEWPS